MKRRYVMLSLGILFFIRCDAYTSSQLQARYSLLQEEINIEVGSSEDFDAYQYLLRNRHPLKEEEKNNFKVQGDVDVKTLGTYNVFFNDAYDMQVTIEDTTAPSVQLSGLKIPSKQSFEWNETSYESIIANLHDNYTSFETLKKSILCDDIDTSSAGNKEVDCRVKDENGNEATTKLAVFVEPQSVNTVNAPSNKGVMGAVTSSISIPAATYSSSQLNQIHEVANLVNGLRIENGLTPLTLDMGSYHNVTYQRVLEVSQTYSHIRPNGQPCYTIFTDYGIGFQSAGENIGQGQQSAQEIVNDWMNSPTHRENILRPEFRILSIGVVGEGTQKVWIQTFIK